MVTLFFKICCCYVIGYVVFYILALLLSEFVFSSFEEHTIFDKIIDFTFGFLTIFVIPAVIGIVISLFLHYAF